jgi:NADH dehydrogenase (ubiquinone) 1 alpha subcomplex subunit 5
MRRTSRLLAAVKASKYLETGAPTGLTGLFTHPAPRSTLLYIYANTLEKLKALPEDSIYRKSTEALTKQRMEIVDAVKPAGYEAWAKKAQEVIAKHPEKFNKPEGGEAYDQGRHVKEVFGKQIFVTSREAPEYDEREVEWDGQKVYGGELEGTRSDAERSNFDELKLSRPGEDDEHMIDLEVEPPLTADQ